MGIYIPGVEMPKGHNYVTITIWPSGTASYGLFDRKENLCDFKSIKAVPIPPHGRLIDADALSKSFEKTANYYYEHNSEVSSSFWSGGEICTEWYAVEDLLENAPTIIEADPAEEGE